ncbi:MAG: hypothetical protein PHS14_10110 [Elusimicrobia bacterium]|nr:hypothetical protein [Elusimicrobiota bacterium]
MKRLTPNRPAPRGQASVEYMMLLCMVLCMALLTGAFLARYGRELADSVAVKLLEAAIALAMP